MYSWTIGRTIAKRFGLGRMPFVASASVRLPPRFAGFAGFVGSLILAFGLLPVPCDAMFVAWSAVIQPSGPVVTNCGPQSTWQRGIVRHATGDILALSCAATGFTYTDYRLARLNGNTGSVIWQRDFSAQTYPGVDISVFSALDPNGDVIVVANDPDPDYGGSWVFKFSGADGTMRWSQSLGNADDLNVQSDGNIMVGTAGFLNGLTGMSMANSGAPMLPLYGGQPLTTVDIAYVATISGNGATRVVQKQFLNLTEPGAPTLLSATPGNRQVSISFSPPASDGGLPITAYRANCSGTLFAGTSSPLVVTGLVNGTAYVCNVQAQNLVGFGLPSASLTATPFLPPLQLVSIVSRKVHGASGAFDLPIKLAAATNSLFTIEPRVIGAGHQIIFTFNQAVTLPASVNLTDAGMNPIVGSTWAVIVTGPAITVSITGIADGLKTRLSLNGVNGGPDLSTWIGFLTGDVNGSGAIGMDDVSAIRARGGQTADEASFRYDLNASGAIGAADIASAKSRIGRSLP